ncbi:MAG: NAD-dependent epimerase/dehydratase family protein [Armatimonadaceae bacterium]
MPDDPGDGAILLTGWTSNTAAALLPRLRERFPGRCIIGASRSHPSRRVVPDCIKEIDLSDAAAVDSLFARHRISLVLHIANIRFTPQVLPAADRAGVPQTICVHTTGMYSRFREYAAEYRTIEEQIQHNPPQHTALTILRPTMIYGITAETRDHNMHKLALHLSRARLFPVFGSGQGKMQPVYVDDVAGAILACIGNPQVAGKAYEISGGSVVTYREVLYQVCAEIGRQPVFVPVPVPLAVPLVGLYERMAKNPRVTVEQVQRLQEDKTFSHEAAAADFGYAPRSFAEGIREEIQQMRHLSLL